MKAKRLFTSKIPEMQVAERCDGVWFRRSKYYNWNLARYVWHSWYQMRKDPQLSEADEWCSVEITPTMKITLKLSDDSTKVNLPKTNKFL